MLENASFVHVFGCMCMLELTITGCWIIVAYLTIPNWFELHSYVVSQLATCFLTFYCDPYFLFQIQNFCLYLVCLLFIEYHIWLVATSLSGVCMDNGNPTWLDSSALCTSHITACYSQHDIPCMEGGVAKQM